MLVLSRKIGERIVVPECNLAVTIVAIEGNKVRLGISASPEVAVYREEIWRQIEEEQRKENRWHRHVPPRKVDKVPASRSQAGAWESDRGKVANPFFITVFHDGETHHELEQGDEV